MDTARITPCIWRKRSWIVCVLREAHRLRAVSPQQIGDVHDVADGAGHFRRTHLQQAVVHPHARERRVVVRLRLGQLVLVMRELQVQAAAVDVERLAEVLHAHGRALDMPPRTPRSPRRLPGRLARLRPLPQREIAGVALLLAHLDARPRFQLLRVAVAQLAVVGVLAHLEVDVAAGGIGVPLVDQSLDHGEDLADVLRGPREMVDAGYLGRKTGRGVYRYQ